MTEKKWWTSRKLWMALASGVLIVGAVLGGRALDVDEELIRFAVGALATIGVTLIGSHAYTDVRTFHDTVVGRAENNNNKTADTVMDALATIVPNIIPVILEYLGQQPKSEEPVCAPRSDHPPSIMTPDGEATIIENVYDVPGPLPLMDVSGYVEHIDEWLKRNKVYYVPSTGQEPVRVGVHIMDDMPNPDTASVSDVYRYLLLAASSAPFYVVWPGTSEEGGRDE